MSKGRPMRKTVSDSGLTPAGARTPATNSTYTESVGYSAEDDQDTADSADLKRLNGRVQHAELLCCAPAIHRGTDHERWRYVWVALGRLASQGDLAVFIFSRSLVRLLGRCWEGLYCVLPVVSNIQVETSPGKITFCWSTRAFATRLRKRTATRHSSHAASGSVWVPGLGNPHECQGDLHLEGVAEESQLPSLLLEYHYRACVLGLTFHSEQRAHHKELLTVYRDFLPMDLAELRSAEIVVPTGLRHNSGSQSRANTLCFQPALRRTCVGTRESLDATITSKLMCVTWNVGATRPVAGQSLAPLLLFEPDADVICVGLQEVCKLNARRIVQDGHEWLAWKEWATDGVKEAFGGDMEFLCHSHLVGLLTMVFVKRDLLDDISGIRQCRIATGVGGYGGNKGAACIRFELGECSMCFVNCHLAAGQEKYIERCSDFQSIFERISFTQEAVPADDDTNLSPVQRSSLRRSQTFSTNRRSSVPAMVSDTSKKARRDSASDFDGLPRYSIHDHHHVFWLGDTNSRIHSPGNIGGVPLDEAVTLLKEYKSRLGELRKNDQLNMMKAEGLAFVGFEEQDIFFLPSYKWWPNKDMYDIRSQKHIPAWTDRVLWRSMANSAIEPLGYDMHLNLKQSDHRLVFATFRIGGDSQGHRNSDATSSSSTTSSTRQSTFSMMPVPRGPLQRIAGSQRPTSTMSTSPLLPVTRRVSDSERASGASGASEGSSRTSVYGEWRMSIASSPIFQEAVVRAVQDLPTKLQRQHPQHDVHADTDEHDWGHAQQVQTEHRPQQKQPSLRHPLEKRPSIYDELHEWELWEGDDSDDDGDEDPSDDRSKTSHPRSGALA